MSAFTGRYLPAAISITESGTGCPLSIIMMNSKYAANRAGFASGLSTAPLASRHRRAGGGAVDNPAYWLHDHLIETTSRSGLLPNNSVVKSRWSLDGLSIFSLKLTNSESER